MAETYGKRSAVFRTGIAESGKKLYHRKKEGLPFGKRGRKGEKMSPFSFNHFNFNVLDLERSMKFYEEALGLHELSRNERDDFIIVFLGDDSTDFRLELTYMKDRTENSFQDTLSHKTPPLPLQHFVCKGGGFVL